MKKIKPEQPAQPGPARRKLSEMISEFAAEFIRLGETPEAKQNYLTGACTAWNIASAPPERRKKLVDDFLAEYKRIIRTPMMSPCRRSVRTWST